MKRRILLVEDSRNDAELLMSAVDVEKLGLTIDLVGDGVEALDYLHCRGAHAGREGDNPVLVLLDVKMPRMGGLELLENLRADARLRYIPVVMLTSSRMELDVARAYRSQVNAYLVKPLEYAEFVTTVKALIRFWGELNILPAGGGKAGIVL